MEPRATVSTSVCWLIAVAMPVAARGYACVGRYEGFWLPYRGAVIVPVINCSFPEGLSDSDPGQYRRGYGIFVQRGGQSMRRREGAAGRGVAHVGRVAGSMAVALWRSRGGEVNGDAVFCQGPEIRSCQMVRSAT